MVETIRDRYVDEGFARFEEISRLDTPGDHFEKAVTEQFAFFDEHLNAGPA